MSYLFLVSFSFLFFIFFVFFSFVDIPTCFDSMADVNSELKLKCVCNEKLVFQIKINTKINIRITIRRWERKGGGSTYNRNVIEKDVEFSSYY